MLLPLLAIAIALLGTWILSLAIASYRRAPNTAGPVSPSTGMQVSLFSLLLFLFAPFNLVVPEKLPLSDRVRLNERSA